MRGKPGWLRQQVVYALRDALQGGVAADHHPVGPNDRNALARKLDDTGPERIDPVVQPCSVG